MVEYSRYQALRVEKQDGVAVVTMNRPERLNAIDLEGPHNLHSELEEVFADLNNDEEVRAAVLTGAGRAFSAGGDIRSMLDRVERGLNTAANMKRRFRGARRLLENMLDLEAPLIAAVNGPATGLGATLALFCDAVIAAESARIGDTHVWAGLVAGDGGAAIWPLLVGVHRAKLYLMTGDLLSAREAERIGLVTQVVPDDQLMETALSLARRLAGGPALAISWSKMAVNKVIKHYLNLVVDTSLAWEMHTLTTQDHAEAARAFLQKRKPQFRGE